MASHDLTLKNYQLQLKDNIKKIFENYMEILKTKTEHINFEVQVRSAEIVRSYQSLMQLVAEIRSFLIINDLVSLNQNTAPEPSSSQQSNTAAGSQQSKSATQSDEKLVRLRNEMSMFLYELEIPLP